jgi:hypothetical protein
MVMSNIALVAGLISTVMATIMFLIGLRLLRLTIKKKKRAGFFLVLSIFSWTSTAASASIVYLTAELNPYSADLFQRLIYVFVFLGAIFAFLFGNDVFYKAKPKLSLLYIATGITLIIIFLIAPINEITVFPDGSNYPLYSVSLVFGMILVGYLFPTIIGISWIALKISNKMEDDLYKRGFKIIAIGQLIIPLTFIMDTLASLFISEPVLYPLFLYLTWVFPPIGAFSYNYGWTLPLKESKQDAK